ncbi:hypothetical protein [Streptomyces sp. NPDC058657]|uniref:hypothetical protein n=1 Tax=unclassified Streptomyces TaxID=2593676 RepID=UPI00365DA66D
MKTGQRRTLRSRLLDLITSATSRLTAAWAILSTAQVRLLDMLAAIRPGRTAQARIRTAVTLFQRAVATFDRAAAGWIERWAATDLPAAYRAGALAMLDHADRPHRIWEWTPHHQATITGLCAAFYADLVARLQEALRRARAFLRAAVDAARARHSRFQHAAFDRSALRREHPLDTVIYANDAHHPVAAWARATVSWQAVTAANTGSARTALEQLSCYVLEVRDGPDCGWRTHNDTDRADKTLRAIDDALAHPAAHPNCQREFLPHFTRPGATA